MDWITFQADLTGLWMPVRSNGIAVKVGFEVSVDLTSEAVQEFKAGAVALEWRPEGSETWYRLSNGATWGGGGITVDADGGWHFKWKVDVAQSEIGTVVAPIAGALQKDAIHGAIRIAALQQTMFPS